jgi:hypothetical protein
MTAPPAMQFGLASLRYFVRGYRFAAHLPPASTPAPSTPPDQRGPLEQYAEQHTVGPGLFKWRHYLDIYDRHLHRFRGQPIHLVEVGVAGGGSLRMWRDYLGPDARISGIDIDPACTRFASEGTEVLIGDQADPEFWAKFVADHPQIDVVIDDGGHIAHQQAVTLECLLRHIRPGGVYACEDIHGPFQPFHAFVDGLTRPLNTIGVPEEANPVSELQRQVASVHRYPIMTVIEKAAWSPAAFESEFRGSEWPESWVAIHPDLGGTPAGTD